MHSFAYLRANSLGEALGAPVGTAFIAGGTSLVDLMRLGVMTPSLVVDINALPLGGIDASEDALTVGALVRNSDLAEHPAVVARFPALSEALLAGASPQLRNMATVGGNLLQRTRCSYFRNGFAGCNKHHPGSGCAALEGENRTHAVLGTSARCIAVHPSDMCVALLAYDAVVRVHSPRGERDVPIADFHLEPGDHPERETALQPGELVTQVTLPALPFFAHARYIKVRDRASYEFALASAAVALDIQNGAIAAARVALGGVATKPWRSRDAEAALTGKAPARATFEQAAAAALAPAQPRAHNAFKVELAKRTLVRALEEAARV